VELKVPKSFDCLHNLEHFCICVLG
jgi:hypothetical protein